ALASFLIIFFSMPEGPGQMFSIASAADKFSLGSLDWNLSESTFWVILVYGLFINLQNFGIDQNYVQRYISARNEKDAIKSTWFGSLLYVPVSLLFFLLEPSCFSSYQPFLGLCPNSFRV